MLKRPVNVGFSGGEKKRNEILQMAVLEPRMCILDETDSGLDVDAMRLVADGVNALRDAGRAFLVITHYQRLLDHIAPDVVHIMADGRIVKTGGPELALEVEANGYADILAEARDGAAPTVDTEATEARLSALDARRRVAWAAAARRERAGPPARHGPAAAARRVLALHRPDTLTAPEAAAGQRRCADGEARAFDDIDALRLVFVDGRFDAAAVGRPRGAWGSRSPRRRRQRRPPLGAGPLRRARGRGPDARRPAPRRAQHRLRRPTAC